MYIKRTIAAAIMLSILLTALPALAAGKVELSFDCEPSTASIEVIGGKAYLVTTPYPETAHIRLRLRQTDIWITTALLTLWTARYTSTA